jgi:L-arabinose isomerase
VFEDINVNMKKIKIAVMPAMADLYKRLFDTETIKALDESVRNNINALKSELYDFDIAPVASSAQQIKQIAADFEKGGIDLLVIFLGPYCPSGVVCGGIEECSLPLLLWPAQSICEINNQTCTDKNISLSHGVHAVQDSANILRKRSRNFGVLHGYPGLGDTKEKFEQWARAASLLEALKKANPTQLGGSFKDMLDLQIGDDEFLKQIGLTPRLITTEQLLEQAAKVTGEQITECIAAYKQQFETDEDICPSLLEKSAKLETALKSLLSNVASLACGINFLELCNDSRVSDAMHIAASILMAEGKGYAAEGDWLTASFVYACQRAFGIASFSEIFAVDYKKERVLLKHWGEGNPLMARNKAKLKSSAFTDKEKAQFAIVDMEFAPGAATLINLNSDANGRGKLITVEGEICEQSLPRYNGARALFRPLCTSISDMLDSYAYSGGSHHLVLANGMQTAVIEKLATLSGWEHINI